MIWSTYLPFALALMIGANLLRVALELIGASRYELSAIQRQRRARLQPYSRQFRRRPLLTIVVNSQNDQATIIKCLTAIGKSSYRKRQILIVDHASTDGTKRLVKSYQTDHPKQAIRLVAKRSASDVRQAARGAVKRHGQGDIVLLLSASDYCDPEVVARAVQHFNQKPNCQVIVPRQSVARLQSFSHLIKTYSEFLKNRSDKSKLGDKPVAQIQKWRPIFLRSDSFVGDDMSSLPVTYAADCLIKTEPLNRKRSLAKRRWLDATTQTSVLKPNHSLSAYASSALHIFCALTLPLLITYCLYLAISLHQVVLLLASGLIVTVLLGVAIWDDNQLKSRQKIIYILGIPVMYGVLYVEALKRAGLALQRSSY